MITPELIAVFGLILSGSVFYLCARRVNKEALSLDGFLLANQSLNENQFSHTFAASSFSLGMMVTFLLANSKVFGVYILVSPLTFVGGYVLYTWVIKNSEIDLHECRTLSDIIYKIYPSRSISKLVTAITLGSYIMLLFVELYVGTIVLTVFLGEGVAFKTFSFFLMGGVSLLYIRLGGYQALVKTDKWQLSMMFLAVASIFLFGLLIPSADFKTASEIWLSVADYTIDTSSMIIFMLWLGSINVFFPFTQLASYQRLSAAKCKNTSWIGVIKGSKNLLLLLLLTIAGFMLIHLKGYEMSNFSDFLLLVKNGDSFARWVLFPILITGGASMIFSSTDIAIIAISYALSDSNTFKEKFSNMSEKELRKTLTWFTVVLLLVLTFIYWLQFAGLQEWLMPLIYTTCGQLAILAPIPLYSLFRLRKDREFKAMRVNKVSTLILFNSIVFAWGLLFVGGYLAKVTGNEFYSLMSMPVGGVVVFCSILFVKHAKTSKVS